MIASIIIGVGFVVAVILAAILAVKRPEWFKNMRRRHNAGMLEFIGSDVIIDDVVIIFYQLLRMLNLLSLTN